MEKVRNPSAERGGSGSVAVEIESRKQKSRSIPQRRCNNGRGEGGSGSEPELRNKAIVGIAYDPTHVGHRLDEEISPHPERPDRVESIITHLRSVGFFSEESGPAKLILSKRCVSQWVGER
eukprot:GHVU01106117.1.p1 GENE.GHVU01106117.1~~GHVU01106117.1.p1  ORF type:complete len:121 (-),score=5.97 GHVU01106117.1:248-610(-)